MKKTFALITVLAIVACFTSCKKKTDDDSPASGDYSHGVVLVSNEGSFSSGTGTISSFDSQTKEVKQNIFEEVNHFPLGNLVQSISVSGDKAYIVVNNAQKVEIVNSQSFASVGTITSLEQPRYFLGINSSKGYITQWGDGSRGELKIVDLATNSVLNTIDIGKGSDRMIQSGNYVFVCNAGGYDPLTYDPVNDSAISVIDVQTDNLVDRIIVGYNPAGVAMDSNGKLWVICYGINDYNNTANNRPGCLVRLDPATFAVELTLPLQFNSIDMRLATNGDGDKIYYQCVGSVYEMPVTATVLPSTPFIDRGFYAFGYDPYAHMICGSNAGDFNSNGYVIRYDEAGALVDSFMTGIGPGNFAFLPE